MIYDGGMTKEILQTMGRRVRVLREERELNQIALAAEVRRRGVECSNSMISSIETGRANPSLEVFVAIADVLDVTLDYLATRTDRIESPAGPDLPEPDAGHGVSIEAQEIANLVDALPPWRRRELLNWLHYATGIGDELQDETRQVADELRARLAAAGLILGAETMRTIEVALLRFVAGVTRPATGHKPGDAADAPAAQTHRQRSGRTRQTSIEGVGSHGGGNVGK